MDDSVEHDILEDELKRCGASWDAAQSHGLLTGRLAIGGVDAGPRWLLQVLEGADESNALHRECQTRLHRIYQSTFWQLSERMSEFEPLLPDAVDDVEVRTTGLAHWCEGFLHGLVSAKHGDALRERLAAEPLSDIIKDLLQITRASAAEDDDDESNEAAYVELVEYLRVAAQLCYEELADLRTIESQSK